MRSPAFAIGWEFRKRLLWVLIAMGLLVLAAIKLLILGPGQLVRLDPPDGRAAMVIVPLSATFFYCLAVFSFGLSRDLAARQSIYPARMFALPVTTRALAGWPMLYGTAVTATLWLGTALFARWPWEVDLPLWPALLAAAFLAWTQALSWMPYGLPGVRVIVITLSLAGLDAVVLAAIHFQASAPVMVAILGPQLPLAYFVACLAVARARRGDVPDWRGRFARPGRIGEANRRPPRHFASPARAQWWFEWRRHGRSLPAWVGILLPFELALLWVAKDTPALVLETLLVVLLTPPFMAAFAAAAIRKANPFGPDADGMAPFVATRPLTSAALIAAKVRMTIGSTVAAWLLVLVAVPLALLLSGTAPTVTERAHALADAIGKPRATVVVLLGIGGLVASTWKQMVQTLYIGLSGRGWLVKTSLALALSLLFLIGPIAQWIIDNGAVRAGLWNALPSVLGVLVFLKGSAAAWVATRLYRSGVLADRALVTGAAGWLAAVLALYGVLAWLLSAPFVPRYLLGLVAILEIPLVRLSAGPLALSWNRHR